MAIRDLRQTHTYAILELSERSFAEIQLKLTDAGYRSSFFREDGRLTIPMQGIAIVSEEGKKHARRKHKRSKA